MTRQARASSARAQRSMRRIAVAVAAVSASVLAAPVAMETALHVAILPDAEASDRPCRIWIQGQQLNTVRDSDGNPRNNPDGTLYPGDAFFYVFYYGFSRECIARYVHAPVVDYRDILAQPSGHSAGTGYVSTGATTSCFGATGGTDELGWFGLTGACGGVSKTVYGLEIHCSQKGKGRKCNTIVRSATAVIIPRIKAPVVEVDMREHILTDLRGYPAANKDLTNYVWDPIAIEHQATFTHRDEREGTITFEYDRSHGALHELGGFERDRRGTGTLVHDPPNPSSKSIEYRPYNKHVHNGGGMYAYSAQDDSAIGRHTVSYTVRVLNEGRQINTHGNSTEQLVVSYEPRYDYHAYPVLADERQYAYDDRHAVAMLYHGSYGGGASDVPEIHPERRSMLAGFNQTTSVGSSAPADAGGAAGVKALDAGLMTWDSTAHINGTEEEPYMSLGEHAMFVERGYGVLRMAQEASGIVADEPGVVRWTDLVWTDNDVLTGRFAGSLNHLNFNYTYVYPPEPMAGSYSMVAYGRDGGIDRDAGMSVTATPLVTFNGTPPWDQAVPGDHGGVGGAEPITFWIDDYLRAKTMRETGNARFVDAVIADTHDRYAAADASYGGVLDAWLPKTALEYRPSQLAAAWEGQFTDVDSTGTVFEIEMPADDDDGTDYDHPFLRLPRHLALATVPYTEFYMTAASAGSLPSGGEGVSAISRNRTLSMYPDYLTEYKEVVNIEAGNRMDARRLAAADSGSSPTIILSVDAATFGEVFRVDMDGLQGRPVAGKCVGTCSLVYPGAGTLHAYNAWGGSATATVNGSDARWYKDPAEGIETTVDMYVYAAAIAIITYAIYRTVRSAARAHEEPAD